MKQGTLFDMPEPLGSTPSYPFVRHSDTSREAAESGSHTARSTVRHRVHDFIDEQGDGGATDEEIIDAIGGNPSGIRPRRIELVQAGLVRDSGKRRATRSGRQAVIWETA